MPKCALCQEVFTSKIKLVQHFGDAHSIARQRARRSKVTETIRRITAEADYEEVVLHDKEETNFIASSRQPLLCLDCDCQFATQASLQSHQCNVESDAKFKKQPVTCQYCAQKCKDRRGVAIHQAFCEKRLKDNPDLRPQQVSGNNVNSLSTGMVSLPTLYECPADDCGAIFKNQDQLVRHIERHHFGEGISVVRSNTPPRSPPIIPQTQLNLATPKQSTQPPVVTVTMKPHIGKTEGLQDLSLLITPTKNAEGTPEFLSCEIDDYTASKGELKKESTSITVEEYQALDGGLGGNGEAVLYVTEDGTVLQASQTNSLSDNGTFHNSGREEEAFLIIAGDDTDEMKPEKRFKCSNCQQCFSDKELLTAHIREQHKTKEEFSSIQIKSEPVDSEDDEMKSRNNDEEWELITIGRRKKLSLDFQFEKGKLEYKCSVCKRHFLSELGYQTHIRTKECVNKKFKLPRMFSCHFKQCDSSFFKLTELQRHWQIAHKFSMASKNIDFDDERTFTNWLAEEEEKHKVRFTCDVKRRKPHRTERLLVCHRFHHLRTAAARKTAKREYSDRHNWIHKIQPCLCFARMKVYQDFNKETCDYTGKISVVYYFEHSHPENDLPQGKEEILDHILQRNKRNRNSQFQDLKGNEKLLHRQKLEKFARLAGKEYRPSVKSVKTSDANQKLKRERDDHPVINEDDEDQIAAVHVANNLLGGDELFASQVEMVFDGQFDMGHEVLAGPVVTHLDSIPIFSSGRVEQGNCRDSEESYDNEKNDTDVVREGTTMEAVLPASTADWGKLFEMVRSRVSNDDSSAVKAEAALILPYEKVIELVSPSEQIPIFRQLWELAYPTSQSQDCIQLEIRMES